MLILCVFCAGAKRNQLDISNGVVSFLKECDLIFFSPNLLPLFAIYRSDWETIDFREELSKRLEEEDLSKAGDPNVEAVDLLKQNHGK